MITVLAAMMAEFICGNIKCKVGAYGRVYNVGILIYVAQQKKCLLALNFDVEITPYA